MGDWKTSDAIRIFPAHTLSDAPYGKQIGVSDMADNGFGAVRAGLRVMPGNEELLELQRSGLMMRSNKFQSTQ
jgi:hypothetical protein